MSRFLTRLTLVGALLAALVVPATPALAAGADIPTATPLAIGETVTSFVDVAGHTTEVWSVQLTEGEEVTITVRGTGDAGSEASATLLAPGISWLSQASQYEILKASLWKGTYMSTVLDKAYTAAKSGTYYVVLRAETGRFAYSLSVQRTAFPAIVAEDSNDILGAVPVGAGAYQGVIEGRTDPDDVYAVQLTAGSPVSFRLEAAECESSKGSGGWLNLLDRTSTSLASYSTYDIIEYKQVFNYSSVNSTDKVAVIDFTPTVSATYYLWVESSSIISSLPYRLTITGNATRPRRTTSFTMRYLSGSTTVANGRGVSFEGILNGGATGIVTVNLQHSANGTTWSNVFPGPVSPAGGSTYRSAVYIYRNRYYRWHFAGNSEYAPCVSPRVRVTTHAYLTAPYAPGYVYLNRAFTSFGTVTRHTAGSKPVRIYAYRWVTGRGWVFYKYTYATVANSTAERSRYSARLSLPYKGSWRIRAYHSDADHLATWSSYDTFLVK